MYTSTHRHIPGALNIVLDHVWTGPVFVMGMATHRRDVITGEIQRPSGQAGKRCISFSSLLLGHNLK